MTYMYVIYQENSADLQKELTILIDFWQKIFNTAKCRVMQSEKIFLPIVTVQN